MKRKFETILFLGFFLLFTFASAMASMQPEIQTQETEQETDFPDLAPNADISIRRSAFGPGRVIAVCFGTGRETITTYRIFKKYSEKGTDNALFEVSKSQAGNDFDVFMKSWHQCEVMIAGYDEAGKILLATPKAYIDTDRFVRQPEPVQNSALQSRESLSVQADASQFPLIRIQGVLPVQMQKRSSAPVEPPAVSESGKPQIINGYQSLTDQTVDILLLTDNSVSMKYQASWFMPKLENFLNGLAQSGMKYRIGLIPFGSHEQTSAALTDTSSVFKEDAQYLLSVLDSELTFDSPYDDAFDALEQASSLSSWNESARKIIVIASNEAIRADNDQARLLLTNLRKNQFEVFAFLPEQSRFSQILTRRTGGGFHHFNNEDMMPILSCLNPASSDFSLAYETTELTGQNMRQVDLSFLSGANARSAGEDITVSYTPPTPFDLMLMPETEALADKSRNRRQSMSIAVSVMKQDPDIPDPLVTLHYKDSQSEEYRTLTMTGQENDIYTADIPAEDMAVFAINYYIMAETSDYQASLPSRNPEDQPFSVAVFPNVLPTYTFPDELPSLIPETPFTVEAEFYDETQNVMSATLYYRKPGETDYTSIHKEFGVYIPKFSAEIPAEDITSAGLEYYIAVHDDKNAIKYIGSMDKPLQIYPNEEAVFPRISKSVPNISGSGFYIWADNVTRASNNDYLATGNVKIGVSTVDAPMLKYNSTLRIAADKTSFRTENSTGLLTVSGVSVKIGGAAATINDVPFFTGNFEGRNSNSLTITPDINAGITLMFPQTLNLPDVNLRPTANSKISVTARDVMFSDCNQDFILNNTGITLDGLGVKVMSGVSCNFSRDTGKTSSQVNFSVKIKIADFDLGSAEVLFDSLNWRLAISSSGLAFGKIMDCLGMGSLGAFAIDVTLNPPAIKRLSMNISIPKDIASQFTVPHVSYSGIPVGIAPIGLGFDVRDIDRGLPRYFAVSLKGAVQDNANIMATLEKFLSTSILSGEITLMIDNSGKLGLSGKVTQLYQDIGKFRGVVSRYAPQFESYGYYTILDNIRAEVGIKGYLNGNTMGFGGYSKLSYIPPWYIATAMKTLGLCSGDCALAGVSGSVKGSLNTYDLRNKNASLEFYSEALFNYSKFTCQNYQSQCCFFTCWQCTKTSCGWTPAQYKVSTSVTLLPSVSSSFGGSQRNRSLPESEPGIERTIVNVQLDNGEEAEAMIEFNYGRPLDVFRDKARSATVSGNTVHIDRNYDYATIIVKSATDVLPQIKVTIPKMLDENGDLITQDSEGNPIVYEYSSTTANNETGIVVFDADIDHHGTVGIIRGTMPGDYTVDILNPSEVGDYKIEVTVPNQPPVFEILSADMIDPNTAEIAYIMTDEDSENPYVTFRLDDDRGADDNDTALYLFPENVSTADFENAKIYGKTDGPKTVRLMIDRSNLKPDYYKLYGRAEDGTTNPVVQWTSLNISPPPMAAPETLEASFSASGILVEWDVRPEEENIRAYVIDIENISNPDESYRFVVDNWDSSATTIAKEIQGLLNGETYSIYVSSVEPNFDYSPSSKIRITPSGMTVSGSPDLTVDLDNTWLQRNDWQSDVTATITVKNIGTAASESALLEIFYGGQGPEYSTTETEIMIDPILPGGTKTIQVTVPQELMTRLTDAAQYAMNYPCSFRIIDTLPKELVTSNNTGIVEKIKEPNLQERTLTIHKGWNLSALPVNSMISAGINTETKENTFDQIFGDAAIWQYRDGQWYTYGPHISESDSQYLNEVSANEGFWIYSSVEKTVTLKDWTYQTNTDLISSAAWSQMGTGEAIDNPLTYFQAADSGVQAIWVSDTNGQWVKNPARIESGQGFWVSRSATAQPPERAQTEPGLNAVLLILKLQSGIELPGFPLSELDFSGNSKVGIEDAIFALQNIVGLSN